jgi:hypothetical protein
VFLEPHHRYGARPHPPLFHPPLPIPITAFFLNTGSTVPRSHQSHTHRIPTFPFSIFNFQFRILHSPFSTFNFQFSIMHYAFCILHSPLSTFHFPFSIFRPQAFSCERRWVEHCSANVRVLTLGFAQVSHLWVVHSFSVSITPPLAINYSSVTRPLRALSTPSLTREGKFQLSIPHSPLSIFHFQFSIFNYAFCILHSAFCISRLLRHSFFYSVFSE